MSRLNLLILFLFVAAANADQPNFVIIMADDLGFGDIGAYRELYRGSDGKPEAYKYTPHLDRLAKEGVRCTRAYATGWCAPSRQVLLSGMWVGRKSACAQPWIGNKLRMLGYRTCMVGKSHGSKPTLKVFNNLDPNTAEFDDGLFFNGGCRDSYMMKGEKFPGRRNFEHFSLVAEGGEYLTDIFTEHAIDFIKRSHAKPFMLYLAHTAPHDPLQGKPEDMRSLFPDMFGRMRDDEIRASSRKKDQKLQDAHYAGMVYALDRSVGVVMKTLTECGVSDKTIVIFTSDNGALHGSNHPLDGHKWDGLEGGIRVPFIVWSQELAGSKAGGSVCDRLVSLADISPTVMAAAAPESKFPTDGIDLMPRLLETRAWPEKRRYLITNSCYTFQNTGALDYGIEFRKGQQLMQYVLVTDSAKVICWNPQGTEKLGVVYRELPDVAGKEAPVLLMKEETPKDGEVPATGPGAALFNELVETIKSSDGDIRQTWSCASDKELANYKWWWE